MENMKTDLLSESKYARPGIEMGRVRFVYLHYTASPMATAKQVRDYFESRSDGTKGFGSSHYVVDEEGILSIIPREEISLSAGTSEGISEWAVEMDLEGKIDGYSTSNYYGISIEMCHPDHSGEFTDETWYNTVKLVANLCAIYGLNPFSDVVTHNIVVDWKECPKWFVDHPSQLEMFRHDVSDEVNRL